MLGAAGGVGLALVLVYLINPAYFGWTIRMHWPWAELAGEASTILGAAVLASLYPPCAPAARRPRSSRAMTSSRPSRLGPAVALALAAAGAGALAADSGPWLRAQPGYEWSFPATTGRTRATAPSGGTSPAFSPATRPRRAASATSSPSSASAWRRTAPGVRPRGGARSVMAHAAIGDFARRDHRFSELLYRAAPLLGGFGAHPTRASPSAVDPPARRPWTLTWDGRGFDLTATDSARRLGFRLTATPLRRWSSRGRGLSAKGRAPARRASTTASRAWRRRAR